MIQVLIITVALAGMAVAVYHKHPTNRKEGWLTAALATFTLIVLRYQEAGQSFIKASLAPVLGLAIFLIIGYLVLSWFDRRAEAKQANQAMTEPPKEESVSGTRPE